jgi:hypothetical protein
VLRKLMSPKLIQGRARSAQLFNCDVTLGLAINADSYHTVVVRTIFTRNIGINLPDILDEISTAFSEHIPAKDGEHDAKLFVTSSLISALRIRSQHIRR